MTFGDIQRIALENLWRTKLRTILTTAGVVIGIGALVSMVSFGAGIQHNIASEFRELDLFTSIQVLPSEIDPTDPLGSGMRALESDPTPLNEETLERIRELPGVVLAYPEITFPGTVSLALAGDDEGEDVDGDAEEDDEPRPEARTTVRAMPLELGEYPPFDEIPYGRFFESDDERGIIVTQHLLEDLGYRLTDAPQAGRAARNDTSVSYRMVSSDELLGATVTLGTIVLDEARIMRSVTSLMQGEVDLPVRDQTVRMKLVGITGQRSGFSSFGFGGNAMVPMETARSIPRVASANVFDLLRDESDEGGFASIHVRVESMDDLDPVEEELSALGLSTLTLADYLEEMRQAFVIMDALLGAVGTVALFVAGLGIANTMVTSILERTREIGVMKAVGGSERDIRSIFFVEAAAIGLMGGLLGLGLGWLVTRIANAIANNYMRPYGVAPTDIFHIPLWLILGAVGFAVVVSLLAGIYPAVRAARIDPVTALRHD